MLVGQLINPDCLSGDTTYRQYNSMRIEVQVWDTFFFLVVPFVLLNV